MLRIGTWNTWWARPESTRGGRVSVALADPDCDILCVTEGYAGILPGGGHVIDAGFDWGYPAKEGRRKVLLWSKWPWRNVHTMGSDQFPSGRLIAGVTQTWLGSLTVVGVCIPWDNAHVRDGRRDRKRWQEHENWLAGFETLPYRQAEDRTVVLGDYNQRIPRSRQPKRVYEALLRTFEPFTFPTAGEFAGAPALAIDHIAHTPDIAVTGELNIWPKRNEQHECLSDHFGIWGNFTFPSAVSARDQ